MIVPEEITPKFHRVRTGLKPNAGWGTQVGAEKFSIQRYFDHHQLTLIIERYKVTELKDVEAFLETHIKQSDDIVLCFNRKQLLGSGDNEHVSLVQAINLGIVTLVDPMENCPDFLYIELSRLSESLCKETEGQLGFWVISVKNSIGG
ncbi:hypothetical protein ES703_45955 [subsurface metagenome]